VQQLFNRDLNPGRRIPRLWDSNRDAETFEASQVRDLLDLHADAYGRLPREFTHSELSESFTTAMRVVNMIPMSRTLGPLTIQMFSANAKRSAIDLPLSGYQTFNDWHSVKCGPSEAWREMPFA
jgi:hypothetical protein